MHLHVQEPSNLGWKPFFRPPYDGCINVWPHRTPASTSDVTTLRHFINQFIIILFIKVVDQSSILATFCYHEWSGCKIWEAEKWRSGRFVKQYYENAGGPTGLVEIGVWVQALGVISWRWVWEWVATPAAGSWWYYPWKLLWDCIYKILQSGAFLAGKGSQCHPQCILKPFNSGNAVPMRSNSFSTMGMTFPLEMTPLHFEHKIYYLTLTITPTLISTPTYYSRSHRVAVDFHPFIQYAHTNSGTEINMAGCISQLPHRTFTKYYTVDILQQHLNSTKISEHSKLQLAADRRKNTFVSNRSFSELISQVPPSQTELIPQIFAATFQHRNTENKGKREL